MNILIRFTVLTFYTCIFASGALGNTAYPFTVYRDAYISFRYPSDLYKKVESPSDSTSFDKFRVYDLARTGNEIVDSITVCGEPLSTCASTENQTRPYWLDADTGSLAIFDTTSAVAHRKVQDGDVYEAFPLCPSTDKEGRSDRYGGECYVAVKAAWGKTYSLTYWLGASGNAKTGRVRMQAIDRARKILDSLGQSK